MSQSCLQDHSFGNRKNLQNRKTKTAITTENQSLWSTVAPQLKEGEPIGRSMWGKRKTNQTKSPHEDYFKLLRIPVYKPKDLTSKNGVLVGIEYEDLETGLLTVLSALVWTSIKFEHFLKQFDNWVQKSFESQCSQPRSTVHRNRHCVNSHTNKNAQYFLVYDPLSSSLHLYITLIQNSTFSIFHVHYLDNS